MGPSCLSACPRAAAGAACAHRPGPPFRRSVPMESAGRLQAACRVRELLSRGGSAACPPCGRSSPEGWLGVRPLGAAAARFGPRFRATGRPLGPRPTQAVLCSGRERPGAGLADLDRRPFRQRMCWPAVVAALSMRRAALRQPQARDPAVGLRQAGRGDGRDIATGPRPVPPLDRGTVPRFHAAVVRFRFGVAGGGPVRFPVAGLPRHRASPSCGCCGAAVPCRSQVARIPGRPLRGCGLPCFPAAGIARQSSRRETVPCPCGFGFRAASSFRGRPAVLSAPVAKMACRAGAEGGALRPAAAGPSGGARRFDALAWAFALQMARPRAVRAASADRRRGILPGPEEPPAAPALPAAEADSCVRQNGSGRRKLTGHRQYGHVAAVTIQNGHKSADNESGRSQPAERFRAVSRFMEPEAARGALGAAQRSAGGDAGGHRGTSGKVRVAAPGADAGKRWSRGTRGAAQAHGLMTGGRLALLALVKQRAERDLVREMPACAAVRIMEFECRGTGPGADHSVKEGRGGDRRGEGARSPRARSGATGAERETATSGRAGPCRNSRRSGRGNFPTSRSVAGPPGRCPWQPSGRPMFMPMSTGFPREPSAVRSRRRAQAACRRAMRAALAGWSACGGMHSPRPVGGAWPSGGEKAPRTPSCFLCRLRPWRDATCLKVRESGRIIGKAAMLAVAVNEDGKRDVRGAAGPLHSLGNVIPVPAAGRARRRGHPGSGPGGASGGSGQTAPGGTGRRPFRPRAWAAAWRAL